MRRKKFPVPFGKHIIVIFTDGETFIFPERLKKNFENNPEILRKIRDSEIENLRLGNEEYLEESYEFLIAGEKVKMICLSSLENELSTLFSKIIHEFKNPLAAMRAMVQVSIFELDSEPVRKDKIRKYASEIIKELDRVNSMLSSIMKIAKPKTALAYRFNIVEEVKKALSFWSEETKMKGIKMRLITNTESLMFLGDADEIHQLMNNLISNSIEAFKDKEGSTIEVEIEQQEGKLKLEVRDNGPGMRKELLKEIGNSFVSTKKNGMGFGLFIVREIVKKNEGDIEISSIPGKGTKTTIFLPLK